MNDTAAELGQNGKAYGIAADLTDWMKSSVSGSFDSFHLLGRTGTARDMANAIYVPVIPATSWVTGAIWHLDGGVMAGRN